jgi:hypothetical protein
MPGGAFPVARIGSMIIRCSAACGGVGVVDAGGFIRVFSGAEMCQHICGSDQFPRCVYRHGAAVDLARDVAIRLE